MSDDAPDRQRLDRWLWHARIVRTRTAAQALVEGGRVRIAGQRITAPARPVRVGDVLTIALDGGVRVLRVVGFAERRGSSDEGRGLYEDIGANPGASDATPPSLARGKSLR